MSEEIKPKRSFSFDDLTNQLKEIVVDEHLSNNISISIKKGKQTSYINSNYEFSLDNLHIDIIDKDKNKYFICTLNLDENKEFVHYLLTILNNLKSINSNDIKGFTLKENNLSFILNKISIMFKQLNNEKVDITMKKDETGDILLAKYRLFELISNHNKYKLKIVTISPNNNISIKLIIDDISFNSEECLKIILRNQIFGTETQKDILLNMLKRIRISTDLNYYFLAYIKNIEIRKKYLTELTNIENSDFNKYMLEYPETTPENYTEFFKKISS